MAQNPQKMDPKYEGLGLRLKQMVEEDERLAKARKSPKTPASAAAEPVGPRPGTSGTHRHGAPGPAEVPSTSAAESVGPPPGTSGTHQHGAPGPAEVPSTSAAESVVPPNQPPPGPSTSTQVWTTPGGSEFSLYESVPVPLNQPPAGQSTSAQVRTTPGGSEISPYESVPVPPTSAESSSSALPTAPVVKKYDRKTELDKVFQLRSILNDVRDKVVKMQDVISMLERQLDMRNVPEEIPREFEVNKPITKL